MYLDYQRYVQLGGQLDADEFNSREAWAELHLNMWTLNRLKTVDWSAWTDEVEQCMLKLIGAYEQATEQEFGTPIASFSNGQDSFSFAEPTENAALSACYAFCVELLPVELMSACVRYNGAS